MKVVFFGTPDFAATVLQYLLDHDVDVVAVISKPDKPKGRSRKLQPTAVKLVAEENQIPIYQPETVSDPAFADILRIYDADLFVVVAYGEIIKQHLLDMPKLGCINLHTSLLPKYRGAAPVQRAIINGEKETGVTIIHMVKKMDAGDMIHVVRIPIEKDATFGEVEKKLCEVGSKAFLEVIRDFEKGRIKEVAQNAEYVTFAPKIELEDCEIDWHLPATTLHNLIRGVNPYPGAWCYVTAKGEKKRLKIHRTIVEEGVTAKPGEILSCDKTGMVVGCGKEALRILEFQLEGKKAMSPMDLTRGSPISFKE